jgi:serine/threonine-protein kinase
MLTVQTESYNRLAEALVEYEVAREQGKVLDRGEFLARYAGLAAELEPLFEAELQIERLARPLRDSLGGKLPLPLPSLDGYEILEEIGHGGMGVVYKARQTVTEMLVALKLLRPDWLATLDEPTRREVIEQFRTEARAAARLQRPNRVHILHLGEHENQPFIVMEFIQGCSLADLLKRPDRVSKDAVVKYLISIAEALQDAHDHGILHRDIKPGNILIDERTDEAKLTDFGLAIIAPSGAGPAEQSVREQKRVAGTLPYMSPEQTRDADTVTVHSDVYSLGATLYEALTGVQPFTGTSRADLLVRIRDCEPEPPRDHNPNINKELEGICLRCLCKVPEQRFTARELAEALRGWRARLQYVRLFTTLGRLSFVLAPTALVIDLGVYWMLQGSFPEPVVWLLMFSQYLLLSPVLLLSYRFPGGHGQNWRAVWGGHIVAAASIAVALRTGLAEPSRDIILLMYSVSAALTGMAYFIETSKMSWKLCWNPVGFWLVGVVMLFHRQAAPIYYGGYLALSHTLIALYLRNLANQLR